ncbi:MAG: hypothetical protein EOO77_29645 [Oxalobacteraceae bacterium]|nr:MAG: hypothetical protein EOO77_29645 [Oxalobacteraceae bacterium]
MKQILILSLLGLALAGCQSTQQATMPALAAVPVPTPQPLVLRDVKWKVYNVRDLEALIAKQKRDGTDKQFAIIAVTPKGYQNLALNLSELERFIREQHEVIVFLKNVADSRGKLGQ